MLGLACALACPTIAADRAVEHQYEGNLGQSVIGLSVLRVGNKIDGGHYFYQRYLQDIPIQGAIQGSDIVLTEPGGGTFRLHFVGNGSDGGKPLNFENSVGMEGAWASADGTRTYTVSLHGTLIRDYGGTERRYADVTTESDRAFEARVQSLVRAVVEADKATAVRFIAYPLVVNLASGRSKTFRNSAAVLAAWRQIFPDAMTAVLRASLPHDMFVHNGLAMLGDGEAWFGAKGLAVLNVPSSRGR